MNAMGWPGWAGWTAGLGLVVCAELAWQGCLPRSFSFCVLLSLIGHRGCKQALQYICDAILELEKYAGGARYRKT